MKVLRDPPGSSVPGPRM
uniref:Uncharacterized protein n=1 Tax=Anguilla anguilla TaxID=7936 RepID=A0A0E9UPW5_ANGAN